VAIGPPPGDPAASSPASTQPESGLECLPAGKRIPVYKDYLCRAEDDRDQLLVQVMDLLVASVHESERKRDQCLSQAFRPYWNKLEKCEGQRDRAIEKIIKESKGKLLEAEASALDHLRECGITLPPLPSEILAVPDDTGVLDLLQERFVLPAVRHAELVRLGAIDPAVTVSEFSQPFPPEGVTFAPQPPPSEGFTESPSLEEKPPPSSPVNPAVPGLPPGGAARPGVECWWVTIVSLAMPVEGPLRGYYYPTSRLWWVPELDRSFPDNLVTRLRRCDAPLPPPVAPPPPPSDPCGFPTLASCYQIPVLRLIQWWYSIRS